MENIKFKYFGVNSIIEKPAKIAGEEHIIISENVFVGAFSWIQTVKEHGGRRYNPYLEIGKGCNIGRFAVISANNKIIIGKNVLMSERVYISDHIHEYQDINTPVVYQPASEGGYVIIEDDCWLGIGCSILRNVTIGKHSIIGTNAVVRNDIPAYSVAVGNPAKVVMQYDHEKGTWCKVGFWNRLINNIKNKIR